jgi:hypothetical protein
LNDKKAQPLKIFIAKIEKVEGVFPQPFSFSGILPHLMISANI